MTPVTQNTIVDGRYRILDRIGSGGMADVYAAEDTHLGRAVALKLLHARFARDAQFVERFRREASAAAKLQHPNVVGVFDRGSHDDTYYIAMEHLRGRPLKDIVADEAPLPQEPAIDIGLQMLAAAGFGHRHGVIHRDFKPHNVIVDADGNAKVTDFGIARAGASEMTETGSIMGTAHYLSPEQAQGHSVTAASDLYSIGVVLYEMLTGRVPFQGDSAVAIALKHLSEQPQAMSSIAPGIHPLLERAVMRALAKDPAERYASAEEFAAALREARAAIDSGDDGQGTTAFAPVAAGAAVPVAVADDGEPPPEEEERRRRWPRIALALLALALLAVALWAALRPDQVAVPSVVGQDLSAARPAVERAGFDVEVERRRDRAPEDEVIAQDPDGGVRAEEGSSVRVLVSDGPGMRTVPTVRGDPEARAVRKLSRAGFRVDTEQESSSEVPAGRSIRTVPAGGTEIEVGSRVRLIVSSGPRRVEVPDVVGLTRSSAESLLDRRGLAVRAVQQTSDEPEGQVIAQDPNPGAEVSEGTAVAITVSSGPERIEVPDVTGETESSARRQLQRAGFRVVSREREVSDETDDGRVVAQRPQGGSERERGDTVTIVVGRLAGGDEEQSPPDPGVLPVR